MRSTYDPFISPATPRAMMFFVQLLTSQQSEQLKNTFPNRADFSKFKSDGSAMALKGQQSANIFQCHLVPTISEI